MVVHKAPPFTFVSPSAGAVISLTQGRLEGLAKPPFWIKLFFCKACCAGVVLTCAAQPLQSARSAMAISPEPD